MGECRPSLRISHGRHVDIIYGIKLNTQIWDSFWWHDSDTKIRDNYLTSLKVAKWDRYMGMRTL
jgi:hypothetical protein